MSFMYAKHWVSCPLNFFLSQVSCVSLILILSFLGLVSTDNFFFDKVGLSQKNMLV